VPDAAAGGYITQRLCRRVNKPRLSKLPSKGSIEHRPPVHWTCAYYFPSNMTTVSQTWERSLFLGASFAFMAISRHIRFGACGPREGPISFQENERNVDLIGIVATATRVNPALSDCRSSPLLPNLISGGKRCETTQLVHELSQPFSKGDARKFRDLWRRNSGGILMEMMFPLR
jgi:hypothetical protein